MPIAFQLKKIAAICLWDRRSRWMLNLECMRTAIKLIQCHFKPERQINYITRYWGLNMTRFMYTFITHFRKWMKKKKLDRTNTHTHGCAKLMHFWTIDDAVTLFIGGKFCCPNKFSDRIQYYPFFRGVCVCVHCTMYPQYIHTHIPGKNGA